MADFLPPLENPDSLVGGAITWIAPCREDLPLAGASSGDFKRCLRSGHKH